MPAALQSKNCKLTISRKMCPASGTHRQAVACCRDAPDRRRDASGTKVHLPMPLSGFYLVSLGAGAIPIQSGVSPLSKVREAAHSPATGRVSDFSKGGLVEDRSIEKTPVRPYKGPTGVFLSLSCLRHSSHCDLYREIGTVSIPTYQYLRSGIKTNNRFILPFLLHGNPCKNQFPSGHKLDMD